MFIRERIKDNGKIAIQVVENRRVGNKVQQVVVRHIGHAHDLGEAAAFRRIAEVFVLEAKNIKNPILPEFDLDALVTRATDDLEDKVRMKDLREERRIIDGIVDVFGKLYSDLGFDRLLDNTRKDAQWNTILKSCVLARVASPASKMKTAVELEKDHGIKIPLEKIYRMMDWLAEKEERVKDAVLNTTLSLFPDKVDVLFFDVTTLYFESVVSDELRENGFSKDCKFKEVQIVLALVATRDGLPITYEIFPGSTYEGHTLCTMVESLKEKFDIESVFLVADRAMFNHDNLEWMDSNGVKYIVAAKLRSLSKHMKETILESRLYRPMVVEDEFHWVNEFNHENRRLIVSYSSARAKKDQAQRRRLIDRLMKKVKNGKLKVKELLTNHGTKKFLQIQNADATIDESKISYDARWDGLHGIVTNDKTLSARDALSRYRGLWQIEESFRINKHDLEMRPIYHWTKARIRAHIAICFLAYTLARQAMFRVNAKYQRMSFERIREELQYSQHSIVLDKRSMKRYAIPSVVTPTVRKLYSVFGLTRSDTPYTASK